MGVLELKNILKFYEFIYERKSIFDSITVFIMLPISPIALYYSVKIVILEKIFGENFMPSTVNKIIVFIAFVLGVIWLVVYKTSLKGVFLYDDYLQIDRHIYSKYYLFNINPKIKYENIKSCTICPKKSRSYKEWNERQLYHIGGYAQEYVRLETEFDKIYCFCVEKQEEFVNEVNQRIIASKENSE